MWNITIIINVEENKKRKSIGKQTKSNGGSDNYNDDVIFIKKKFHHIQDKGLNIK